MKHMKKSMFITTLLMVVLLVVALSTATFAWFTANDTVVATQTTMTAATSSAANITINWQGQMPGSSIDFDTATGLLPLVPTNYPSTQAYTSTNQYVATSLNTMTGQPIQEAPYVGATAVTIIPNITDATIAVATVSAYAPTATLVGTPGPLKRVYHTQFARAAYQTMRPASETIADTLITKYPFGEEPNVVEYSYLNIVADAPAKVNANDVTVAEADDMTLTSATNADQPVTAANIGYRIYNVNAVKDIYTITEINADAPATFYANGMGGSTTDYVTATGGVDFLTLVTVQGTVNTSIAGTPVTYYIEVSDVKAAPYLCANAVAGDTLVMPRASSLIARTTYDSFVNTFFGSSIDNGKRFRADGQGTSPVTLNELGEANTTDVFELTNNNAAGAPAANITMSAAITTPTEGIAPDLRIAVFVKNDGDAAFYYSGTMTAAVDQAYYGTIIQGADSTQDLDTYATQGNSLANFIQLDPQKTAQVKVIVWFDGEGLISAESGLSSDFSFSFTATNVAG